MDAGTQWRGQADTRRRRFAVWILVSFLLHTPLTPLAGLLSFLRFLGQDPGPEVAYQPMTEIPIDLIQSEESSEGEQKPEAREAEPAAMQPATPEAVVVAPKPRAEPLDAGVPESDGGAADAAAAGPSDGGADDAAGPRPGQGVGDPMAMVHGDKRVVDRNANVQLLLHTDRIRHHQLGARIGPMLRSVYQWRDFFGPTGIDPIRDIDRMLIAGPQLRDSSAVTALLRHNVGEERMKQAIDAITKRDPSGGWLDAGVPAASARVDRAERMLVMTSPNVVVVAPPSVYESVLRNRKAFRLDPSAGSEVLTAHVTTPSRVLIGVNSPVQVPATIKWARAKVTPTADGGAFAEIEAEDESPELAERNASYLTQAGNAATQINLGILGGLLGKPAHRILEHVSFHAEGSKIYGTIRATRQQLETALGFAGAMLAEQENRRRPRTATSGTAATPGPGAPGEPP